MRVPRSSCFYRDVFHFGISNMPLAGQRPSRAADTTLNAVAVILFFAVFLVSTGCQDRRAWTSTDAWFHPPTTDLPPADRAIENSRIETVSEEKEIDAEETMGRSPFVEISLEQAKDLVGLPLLPHPGAKIYLVRAVYLDRRSGAFQVYRLSGNDILVYHECLGGRPLPMKRQALVLQLNQPPREVFTLCRMGD